MRIVVTGARGKVGRAVVADLLDHDHAVIATDQSPPVFERDEPGAAPYVRADLTDAGAAFQVIGGADAVVHCAAIPDPQHDVATAVFANNVTAAFNVIEACVRWRVPRLVNVSSETVPGMTFAQRPFDPVYFPIDEDHPIRPQDPYAVGKHFAEQLCDAAVRRSDLRCISIRPTWVQDDTSYERNLGPMLWAAQAGHPEATTNGWSYIDATDLAQAVRLAAESDLGGHEIFRTRSGSPTPPPRCASSSARTSSCARSRSPRRQASRRPRRCACWAGRPPTAGGTASTRTAPRGSGLPPPRCQQPRAGRLWRRPGRRPAHSAARQRPPVSLRSR